MAFRMLSKPVGPPPPEVAKDALLTQGREIYLRGAWPVTATTAAATGRWPPT